MSRGGSGWNVSVHKTGPHDSGMRVSHHGGATSHSASYGAARGSAAGRTVRAGPYDRPAAVSALNPRTPARTAREEGTTLKDRLVVQIKELQRTSNQTKHMWERFCDDLQTGSRDPLRHTVSVLQHFLAAYEQGEEPQVCQIGDGRVLRLRGVPFQSEIAHVAEFLSEYNVKLEDIAMGQDAKGKRTGEAYVVFPNRPSADHALKEMQKGEIEGRYIELFRSSHEEMEEGANLKALGGQKLDPVREDLIMRVKKIQRDSRENKQIWDEFCDALRTGNRDPKKLSTENIKYFLEALERGEKPKPKGGMDCRVLRLRGVPFQSNTSHIVEFLSEYGVEQSQVAMGCGPDGKRTGEAFAAFDSSELAEMALDEKQNQEILGRYIELFRSSFEERDQSILAIGNDNELEHSAESGTKVTSKEQLVNRVKQIQRADEGGKDKWYAYCDVSRTGNRDPARHSKDSLSNFLEAYDRGEVAQPKLIGDGRVLRLRGVPYQCTKVAVANFLTNYGVDRSQVALGVTPEGRSTGEGFAVFPTSDLAESALDEMQKQEIDGRFIELFRSSHEELEEHTGGLDAGSTQMSVYDPGVSHQASADAQKEAVAQVKNIQRRSAGGKEKWEKYCASMRMAHDPGKHSVASLNNFINAHEEGREAEALPVGDCKVLRLRGVPFECGIGEVCDFLCEYNIDKSMVALGRNRDGRKSGEAYAIFHSGESAEHALEHMQNGEISGRYIELFRSSENEFQEHAEFGSGGDGPMQSNRGASAGPGVDEKEKLVTAVKSVGRSSNPPGREAWVTYCREMRTAQDPSRHNVDSLRNFLTAWDRGETPQAMIPGDGKTMRLRGVPFQCTEEDIARFLTDYEVDPSQIARVYGADGKKTGEAYVMFPSADHAEAALAEMQHQELEGRYIEFFRSSSEELEAATGGLPSQGRAGVSGRPHVDGRYDAKYDKWAGNGGVGYAPMRGQGGVGYAPQLSPNRGSAGTRAGPYGAASARSAPGDDYEKEELVGQIKQLQRSSPSTKTMWEMYCDDMHTGSRDPQRHTSETMRNFLDAHQRGVKPKIPLVGDGRCLRLRGVPFQADVQDILEFLSSYRIQQDKVSFGADPRSGRRSGEAYVVFPSKEIADSALYECQKAEIQGRYIELYRCTHEERFEATGARR